MTTAREESLYAKSLIEASLDPLVTISTEGKITEMNRAMTEITGLLREQMIGSDFFGYFTEPDVARSVYKKVFAEGAVADLPLTVRRKDGKLIEVRFNGSVFKDDIGNIKGVLVVTRDVSQQQKIANELTEARIIAEQAREVAEEATRKAVDATRMAEEAVKAKQQFLSNMSHEIRTPMNAIIGFTKVVLRTDLTSRQKEYIQAIKTSGDALIVLINDILDLAKVDAGKMNFVQTPFKMSASISAMLHLFETKIQEKNLTLVKEYDTAVPEVLMGDPVRLHQIILNLVSNAVKFTSVGQITVGVKLIREEEENVTIEFSVKDTGIGIHEDKIDTIFENFQQASSNTSRLYGGTGLGLAIVKQLVEAQGGTTKVNSIVDQGSTFSFTLSFQKTKGRVEIEQGIVDLDTEMKNISILVVEDIALNQLLMKTLLEDAGFGCDIASNGRIAIEKLEANTYDIILMDLQMPEMNGFEATEHIRSVMRSDIPIMALTADVTTVDLSKCKAVGMNDYIAKPVDERLLYSKILTLVKRKNGTSRESDQGQDTSSRYTNLENLTRRTKSNPELMMQMISLYLEQTPSLITEMKLSMEEKKWTSLYSAVHKIIPSFSIMGMSAGLEDIAKNIQQYASTQEETHTIPQLVLELEKACTQACSELKEELEKLKKLKNA